MEMLKSLIPEKLKQRIVESSPKDLHFTCSSLLDFYQTLPLFHQIARDLTDSEMGLCCKNKEAALEAKANGNTCFSKGDFSSALRFYSQALQVCPKDTVEMGKNLVATLYVNRAASFHKLGFYEESLRDCSRALLISPAYAKAWFRRAKANTFLGNHGDAINDLNISLEIETSVSARTQIKSELKVILNQCEQRRSRLEKSKDDIPDIPLHVELQSVLVPTKGRGMTCLTDVPKASLIHKEDPYAVIILKQCRKTHCHYCFNELPRDSIPCVSCSIPFYCSTKCQVQAGGWVISDDESLSRFLGNLSVNIQDHVRNVMSLGITISNLGYTAEHKHECQGVHWPVVLPSDVVLAGRVLVRYLQEKSCSDLDPDIHEILDLCQNYQQLSKEIKFEFHVYAVILLLCLQKSCGLRLPLNSVMTCEIIMLLSQIRVNSMAIVRMKYSDAMKPLDYCLTSSVEQVQVAQAIYTGGSLFNHSCKPNVHAYFISRTLFVRVTEYVAAGSQLELSYGPQVGQMGCSERRQVLEERYSFICQCSCCAKLNIPDLVVDSYGCNQQNCLGVMYSGTRCEKEKLKDFKRLNLLQGNVMDDDIRVVASRVYEKLHDCSCFQPCHCLNCGSYCDLRALQKTESQAEVYMRRLQESLASNEVPTNIITDALKSIDVLKTMLHPYNKKLAEVEDNIAQALCLAGELQAAVDHCEDSIKILEKLYGKDHIVIGNELIKLVSIKVALGHKSAEDDVNRLVDIFSRYYGSHTQILFQHLQHLKKIVFTV